MSDHNNDIEAQHGSAAPDANDARSGGDGARVRFKGIVEAPSRSALAEGGDINLISRDEQNRHARSRQAWLVSWLTALFIFFSIIVGLPLGNWIAYLQLYNTSEGWSPFAAYDLETFVWAFIIPALVLLIGYITSRAFVMMNAAEAIANVAQQMVTPDVTAAQNVETVGAVVQTQMDALNQGLDGALTRLASVEAMIRQHVEAIEVAGEAIEFKATGAVTRVADERSRLMDLTESLNAHADSFAAAIAERANASIDSLQSADQISVRAEREFDERLSRLEDAASRALTSFESLRDALRDSDDTLRNAATAIDDAAAQTVKASERAQSASDAAAQSAARNAANVAASAARASDAAKEAAEEAIEIAGKETERIAAEAIEFAMQEGEKVQDAAASAVESIAGATKDAVTAAVEDAAKATKAAEDVAEAARKTSEAAAKAAADVSAASEQARERSMEAQKVSETEAARLDERNKALADARAALEHENERLESLIEEQRKRADRLADAIASQTERLSRLADAQLREQEAAARLTQAQNEMQERADQEAAERQRAEAKAAEEKAKADAEAARRAAEPAPAKPPARPAKPKARNKPAPSGAAADANKDAPAPTSGAARLEELARDIAERRPRRSATRRGAAQQRREPTIAADASPQKANNKEKVQRNKKDVSWREILNAAEDAEPLELGPAQEGKAQDAKKTQKANDTESEETAIRMISRLQGFTYQVETRLYGDPPPALQERFDRGDRNVFANRLLRLNEADVKRRIRMESARDKNFERGINEFLQGFEGLLEDATTSETADEELEEYLSSPLGRVYLLIGATVGYFA